MKKLALFTLMALTLTTQAYQFRADAQVYFDRTNAQVTVCNNLPQYITCSGRAIGITRSGHQVYSYMNNAPLSPGQCAYLYVYTDNYNPFVRVAPQINCSSF